MRRLALLLPLLLPASAEAGRSGAILLRAPFGPRAVSMGQAYSALGDDAFAMSYNPASLSRLTESQAATQFSQSFADVSLGYLGVVSPLDPVQALGASLSYLDAGKIDVYDSNGVQVRNLTAQRDVLFGLGYSRSFAVGPGRWHLGGGAKLLRSVLFDETRALTTAADVGNLYELKVKKGLALFGLAATNIGPPIKYSGGLASGGQSDPLPTTLRLATAYSRDFLKTDTLSLSLQADELIADQKWSAGVGVEYNYRQLCAMRVGYRWGQDLANITLGIGLGYGNVSMDYGLGLAQTFNNVHQISFSYRFSIPGIRYRQPPTAPAPIDVLLGGIEAAVADRRFFDAGRQIERLDALFPGTTDSVRLKGRIEGSIQQSLSKGSLSSDYDYSLGFKHYQYRRWKQAVSSLEAALRIQPNNKEIEEHLSLSKARLAEDNRQRNLERQARIAGLLELAHQTFEAGNRERALRIIDEILRLGRYPPAQDLAKRILTKPAPRKPARPAKDATRPAAARPTPEAAAKAELLYYQAIRSYAEDDLEQALSKLYEVQRLNPHHEELSMTLSRVERELNQLKRKRD